MNKKSRFIEYTLDKLAFGDDNKTRSEDIKTFFSKVRFLPTDSLVAITGNGGTLPNLMFSALLFVAYLFCLCYNSKQGNHGRANKGRFVRKGGCGNGKIRKSG